MLGQVGLHHLQALGPILHANHVARADDVAGNVHVLAVDRDMPVSDELPRLGPAEAESQTVYHIVQAALQQAHQRVAGIALGAGGAAEVAAKLPLQHAVVMLDLLLLPQVQRVVGLLAAAKLVHARRGVAALDRTLGGVAASALQKQFQTVAATESADRSSDSSHTVL